MCTVKSSLTFLFSFSCGTAQALNLLFYFSYSYYGMCVDSFQLWNPIGLGGARRRSVRDSISTASFKEKTRRRLHPPPPTLAANVHTPFRARNSFPIPNFHFYEYLLSRVDFQRKKTQEELKRMGIKERVCLLSFFLCVC